MSGFFVTGTDTGVGKTFVAAALIHALQAKGWRVAPMKPVAAGVSDINGKLMNEDVATLMALSDNTYSLGDINPYCFAKPIAPHIAAQYEGVSIELEVIRHAYQRLAKQSDIVLVEGAGGFLVPLSGTESMAAIPTALSLEVILVVGMRLGCINHALLSAEAIQARSLKLAGWIANVIDPEMLELEKNIASLQTMIKAPLLGVVPHLLMNSHKSALQTAQAAACLNISLVI